MDDTCSRAGSFLESLFQGTGLNIRVSTSENPTECLLDLSGPDAELLQVEGGELLQAMQHLVSGILRFAPMGVFALAVPLTARLGLTVCGLPAER